MRYVRLAVALVVLGVLAMVGPAVAVPVTVQNGLDGYAGTDDTYTVASRNGGPWGNAGAFTQSAILNDHGRASLLVRFSGLDVFLSGQGVTSSSAIQTAKILLYTTGSSFDPAKAEMDMYRMTHTWNEGVASSSFNDYSTVDGANNAAYAAPRLGSAASWSQPDAGTYPNVWATTVTSKVAGISEKSTYHDGFCAEVGDIATVNSTTNSFYSTATTLYVNTAQYNTGSRYWLEEDLWPEPGWNNPGSSFQPFFQNSVGLNDVYDSTDPRALPIPTGAGDWLEVDITDWVKDWFDNDLANHGVLVRRNSVGDYDGVSFAFSEYGTAGLRPMLEITLEELPVAEPAGLGIIGLALLGLKKRSRSQASACRRSRGVEASTPPSSR
jgi:hypothetical protein